MPDDRPCSAETRAVLSLADRSTPMSPLPGMSKAEALAQVIAERVVGLVLDAIDLDALVASIDLDALVSRLDVAAVVDRVDVDALVDRVDVEKIIERVDVDAIVSRVDVEKIIERVDVDAIVSRVDVEKIIDRVDIERVISRVDIDAIVEQTELGTIIARSTSGVASSALDVVRAQGVGLDDFVMRWINRILRRDPSIWPEGPSQLVTADDGSGQGQRRPAQDVPEIAP